MGSCFSKKKESSSSSSHPPSCSVSATVSVSSKTVPVDPNKCENNTQKVEVLTQATKQEPRKREEGKEEKEEEGLVKKEIFVIKHRKSHDRRSTNTPSQQNEDAAGAAVVEEEEVGKNMVRTSSCTKEEVDAILIQCGRLSRSNSSGKTVASSSRKYSGSKRSYDFDHNEVERDGGDDSDSKKKVSDEDDEKRQHRQRHRQGGSSRHSPSPSQGRRRRTPSREREREREREQRSGSRERGNGGGAGASSSGRRVSRSPGRRSENSNTITTSTNNGNACNNRPGKMVSVPASVNSLVMDKSNNSGGANEPPANGSGIKRISVKRNAGGDQGAVVGSRSSASPRSQSPARANANVKSSNENQQQPSLSRSSSRKAEHSPYRRNPLSEIDPNTLAYPQSAGNNKAPNTNPNRVQNKNREIEGDGISVKEFSTSLLHQAPIQKPDIVAQGTNHKTSSRGVLNNKVVVANCTEREHQRISEETKAQVPRTGNNNVTLTTVVAVSGAENQKPQTVTRSRSSRLSRDLDINPETLMNPSPSYTALLLEDIQNFHQKSNNPPSISLPACVSKACSILEAVADLNSTTSSNLSGAFSEDRKSLPADHSNNKNSSNLVGKKMAETNYRDPFVESEVLGSDDLMEPSFHKYVTVRRGGTTLGVDLDDQESSGSNSFVGGSQQNWSFSSSSWEPNSAESTDRWTSRSNTREYSPLGFQKHALSETGCDENKARKGFSGTKRDNDSEKVGIGRGRVGAAKGLHTVSVVGVTAST